jgi:hypothetical protein
MDKNWNRAGVIGTWVACVLAGVAVWETWPKSESGASPEPSPMTAWLMPSLLISALVLSACLHLVAALVSSRKAKPNPEKDNAKADDRRIYMSEKEHQALLDERKTANENYLAIKTASEKTISNLESRLTRLQERDETWDVQVAVRDDEIANLKEQLSLQLNQIKTQYGSAMEIADYQAAEIADYVEIVRTCTYEAKLDASMPTIKWGLALKNKSLFKISIDGEIGPLFFEGHDLAEIKKIKENEIQDLWPEKTGQIVFEQRLSHPEVNLIEHTPDGNFEFDKVVIRIKGGTGFDHIVSRRVIIPPEFRATLGKCSDSKSQATKEIVAERDALQERINVLTATLAVLPLHERSLISQLGDYRDEGNEILRLIAERRVLVPYEQQFEGWKGRVQSYLEKAAPGLAVRFRSKTIESQYPGSASNNTRSLVNIIHTRIMRLEEFIAERSR